MIISLILSNVILAFVTIRLISVIKNLKHDIRMLNCEVEQWKSMYELRKNHPFELQQFISGVRGPVH